MGRDAPGRGAAGGGTHAGRPCTGRLERRPAHAILAEGRGREDAPQVSTGGRRNGYWSSAPRRWWRSLLARLRNYLLTGIVVTAPISITLYIVWQIVDFFDEWAAAFIPARYNPNTYLPFSLPGLGFLLMLGLLVLVGRLTASYVGHSLVRMGERILRQVPVVRSIYGTLKQIFETVLSSSSRSFREVVLVEYPRRGLWSIAFVTGPAGGEIARRMDDELVNVFLPTTPNPTSGYLLFVPRRDLVHLDMTVEDAMKLVISGGIVVPEDLGARASAGAQQRPHPVVAEELEQDAPRAPEPVLGPVPAGEGGPRRLGGE